MTLLTVGVLGCFGFTTLLVADFYTQKKIDTLGVMAAGKAVSGSGWYKRGDQMSSQPNNLYLGQLLYANIYSHNPGDGTWWGAGNSTSDVYKNGWRTMIVNKPSLAYVAVKQYGPSFFTAFDNSLMETKNTIITQWKDGAERAPVLNKFSRSQYWKDQRIIMGRYDRLINALLKLNDAKLNQFVADMDSQLWKGNESTELQRWLLNNQLIGAIPQEYKWGDDPYMGGWSLSWYPVDILFLARRVSRDFPQWTPRKFLMEAKWFGEEARKYMPGGASGQDLMKK